MFTSHCGIIQLIVGLPYDNNCWIKIHVSDKLSYNNNAKDVFVDNIQLRILFI